MPFWRATLRASGVARTRSPSLAGVICLAANALASGRMGSALCTATSGVAATAAATSIRAMVSPTVTISPSSRKISTSVPLASAGNSATVLSVSISSTASPRSKLSPAFFSQRTIRPSAIVSPRRGIARSVTTRSFCEPAARAGCNAAGSSGEGALSPPSSVQSGPSPISIRANGAPTMT